MKATDLRIGNWVSIHGSNQKVTCLNVPFAVLTRNNGDEGSMPGVYADISGIPLTEEILLKCGFKVVSPTCEGYNNQSYSRWENTIQIVLKHGSFNLCIDSEDEWYSFAWVKITSVHQLQNLYYALTGEELTVNL